MAISARASLIPVMLSLLVFVLLWAWIKVDTRTVAPAAHQPAWPSQALWIAHPEQGARLYARRAFNLADLPEAAVLRVVGADFVDVYLNGRRLGFDHQQVWRAGLQFDVVSRLRRGENVIAVETRSTRRHAGAAVRVQLEYDFRGQAGRVLSDGNWRVSNRFEYARNRQYRWNEPGFSDAAWSPSAMVVPTGNRAERTSIVPMLSVRRHTEPAWLWGEQAALSFTVERQVHVQGLADVSGWLGAVTDGQARIWINGREVYGETGGAARMPMLSLKPYLREGSNTIRVQAASAAVDRRLAIVGLLRQGERWYDFSSGPAWRPAEGGQALLVMGRLWDRPPVLLAVPPGQDALLAVEGAGLLGFYAALLAALLWLGALAAVRIGTRGVVELRPAAWSLFAVPFVLMSLLLLGARLVDWDPRFDLRETILPQLLSASLVVTLLWLCLYPWLGRRLLRGRAAAGPGAEGRAASSAESRPRARTAAQEAGCV